jgi:hypothetical protein
VTAQLVEWDDVGADDGYRVKWGTAPSTYPNSADVAQNVLQYRIANLGLGVTYYWVVAALVAGVEQTYTAEQSFVAKDIQVGHLMGQCLT